MLFKELSMVKNLRGIDYSQTFKNNTIICVCLPPQNNDNHEAVKYLKKNYPEVYKKHTMKDNELGSVEVHYIRSGLLLARVYSHVNMLDEGDELYMSDMPALEKALRYIHEIYSDYTAIFKDENLDIGCTVEEWEKIKDLLIDIYGEPNDDAICKVIFDRDIIL